MAAPRPRPLALIGAILVAASLVGCTSSTRHASASAGGVVQTGLASWYGEPLHGRRTASGEPFNMHDHTAAHPTLPFGTRVSVENLENGRSVIVRINDRGPFVRGRIIDLSRHAAEHLGYLRAGVTRVRIQQL